MIFGPENARDFLGTGIYRQLPSISLKIQTAPLE